jgi:hypothetical protein
MRTIPILFQGINMVHVMRITILFADRSRQLNLVRRRKRRLGEIGMLNCAKRFQLKETIAATTPRTRARELASPAAPAVGALVAAVWEAVPELVAERLVVRELAPVEASV